ncbi:hypothetical protein KR084_000019, partial [Drosophila pseudotakahashii]
LQLQGQHVCGGSIYSKDIIITAAHCRFDEEGRRLEAEHFKIRAGSALWNYGGKRVEVAAIISHDMYNHDPPYEYDIAVMRLSEPLTFSNNVQPIPLAKNNPSYGTPAYASGWGATFIEEVFVNGSSELNATNPIHLQGLSLQIMSSSRSSVTNNLRDIIDAGIFRETSCRGDSGGPLVVDKQLVGVVSSGPPLCDGQGHFTSVAAYRSWILDAIK